MNRYTTQPTIDLWNQAGNKTTKELIDTLGEIIDDYFSDVKTECIFLRIKERLGFKVEMPNTNTFDELISFGTPENEIVSVQSEENN